jgi:hypothetical protein
MVEDIEIINYSITIWLDENTELMHKTSSVPPPRLSVGDKITKIDHQITGGGHWVVRAVEHAFDGVTYSCDVMVDKVH